MQSSFFKASVKSSVDVEELVSVSGGVEGGYNSKYSREISESQQIATFYGECNSFVSMLPSAPCSLIPGLVPAALNPRGGP